MEKLEDLANTPLYKFIPKRHFWPLIGIPIYVNDVADRRSERENIVQKEVIQREDQISTAIIYGLVFYGIAFYTVIYKIISDL